MVISDFSHLGVGAFVGVISNIATASSVCSSRPAFPTGPRSICLLGVQQASSLSSKHKLWNFHRSC